MVRRRLEAWGAALVATALGAGPAGAQPAPAAPVDQPPDERPDTRRPLDRGLPPITGGMAYWENDWWYSARNEDRNYTNGFGIQVSGPFMYRPNPRVWWSGCLWACLPVALEGLNRLTHVAVLHRRLGGGKADSHSLTLGSTAFTPDDLGATDVVEDDRPYASLMFLSASRLSVDEDRTRSLQSELTVGVFGLDLTRRAQTAWHQGLRDDDDVDPKDPLGWHHQISDGNEPTLRYRLQVRELVAEGCVFDVTGSFEGSAGYYTNVAGGGAVRIGLISTPFWLFDSTPLEAGDQVEDRARMCAVRTLPFELYAWTAGRTRVVLYNAMLQGQFAHSDHRIGFFDISRLLLEGEAGLTLGAYGFTFTYLGFAGRTPEFIGDTVRSHTWGGVWLGYRGGWDAGE